MKISAIRVYNTQNSTRKQVIEKQNPRIAQKNVNFKGDTGAVIGIWGGAAIGALVTAAVIATGGLAGVVAAIGTGSTIACGAGACTHLGGIAGSIIEENINKNGKG